MRLDKFGKTMSKILYHAFFLMDVLVFLLPSDTPVVDMQAVVIFTAIAVFGMGLAHLTEDE